MKRYIEQEQVEIAPHPYIYRVVHRIMEGDCKMDHGPLLKMCIRDRVYAYQQREW